MIRNSGETIKNFLAILAVAIIIAVVGQAVSIISYNNKIHTTNDPDDSKLVSMDLGKRTDSTSSWLKLSEDHCYRCREENIRYVVTSGNFF